MKNGIKIYFLVLLTLLLIGLGKCYYDSRHYDDYVRIKKSTLDSIKNLKPDTIFTIRIDTVKPDTIIKWFTRIIEKQNLIQGYTDSLKTDEVLILVHDSGYIAPNFKRKIGYKLFVPKKITETQTIEVTKKVPVYVYESEKKYYLSLGTGFSFNSMAISGEFGKNFKGSIFKKKFDYSFGGQYIGLKNENVFLFKYTIKL